MVKEIFANSHFTPFCSSHIGKIANLRIDLTDELTSWKAVLLEELIVPHLVEKFSVLY